MKKIAFILLVICSACSSRPKKIVTEESNIQTDNPERILVPSDYDNLLQIDSLFASIDLIPLETNKYCLISSISKVIIANNCVYIQNRSDNLYVFSISGEFIRAIGKKGNGPGEFRELRDFDIDVNGNIYILDFLRILKYSHSGEFLDKYKFEYAPGNTIQCNPLQFALCDESNFYVWGGSFGIKENKNKNLFLMYKMNKTGEITERYFPLEHNVVHNPNQFSKYSNYYNVVPWYGNNTIYKVSGTGVSKNYIVDFGAFTFENDVPEGFQSLSEFKAKVDQQYANSINNITETGDWLYFTFSFKKYIKNVFYSKKRKKVFVSKPYPRVPNRIMPWTIHSQSDGDLFALIEPRIILEDLKRMDKKDGEVESIRKVMQNSSINDNPILMRCKMKKY
jgi:hypothetical protein